MGVLKKLKSSTLVETLVATVLILVVFVLSSLILNTVFRNTVRSNTYAIDNRLYQLEYQVQNDLLEIPYGEDFKNWEISIVRLSDLDFNSLQFKAIKAGSNQTRQYDRVYEDRQ